MNILNSQQQLDILTLSQQLHRSVPEQFLATHQGIIESIICGILLRNRIDDHHRIERLAGIRIERVVVRIAAILADPDASVWFFAALDRYDLCGMPFPGFGEDIQETRATEFAEAADIPGLHRA